MKDQFATRPRPWRRTAILMVVATACATLVGCSPPQKPKVVVLTPLSLGILDASIAGLREELARQGFGPNKIDIREVNAAGQMQMLSSYAREIAASHPDVIVPVSTPATEAVVGAAAANQMIVFSTVTNPAKAKVLDGAANITGVSDVVNFEANVALLQQLFPAAKRVGTIFNPGDSAAVYGVEKLRALMPSRGLKLIEAPASTTNDAVNAARTLSGQVDVILVGSDSNAADAMAGISAVASKSKIPVLASDADSVRNGAVAAISVDYHRLGEAAGNLVAVMLRTHKSAGQIPRVRFQGNTLVLNRASAAAIGLVFPPEVLARNPQFADAK